MVGDGGGGGSVVVVDDDDSGGNGSSAGGGSGGGKSTKPHSQVSNTDQVICAFTTREIRQAVTLRRFPELRARARARVRWCGGGVVGVVGWST